jgi:hypothetical protein
MHGSNFGQDTTILIEIFRSAFRFLHTDAGTGQGKTAAAPFTYLVIHRFIIIPSFDII